MRWVLFTTMGRQSRSSVLAALLGALWSGFCMVLFVWPAVDAAIVAPPWSNPSSNPCALQPGGWQLLYWAPLKKCFKIFTTGFPCPETMELSPVGNSLGHRATLDTMAAECRCPPGTALSEETERCHKIFERGPCEIGEYFAPIMDSPGRSPIPKMRLGQCRQPSGCLNGMAYWPPDGKCYSLHTRGPCSRGKLLSWNQDQLAECACDDSGELAQFFYSIDETCHEHYTKGPCDGIGQLFLPGGNCGCNERLPHFNEETNQCYEIGTIGPCPRGHQYVLSETSLGSSRTPMRAMCQCKDGYVPWNDGQCYRMYTRGPCGDGQFVMNSTSCIDNPCAKGRLYFPEERTCYRIGTQGPCNWQQVVVFDFTVHPSLDGISYNGVCGCSGIITNLDQQCSSDDDRSGTESACASMPGMVEFNGKCYKLYSRGPCGPGQWLEPKKIVSRKDRRGVQCQCRPSYTKYESNDGLIGCYAPSVSIARYLNGVKRGPYTFGFRRIAASTMSEDNSGTAYRR